MNGRESRYFIKSIEKGFAVLSSLCEMHRPLTLSEIAASMDINATTATRLCFTLSQLGFIHRDNQKRYHLTPKILTLGYPVIASLDWLDIARTYLEKLHGDVQETVCLSILEDSEIMYLIRIRKVEYLPFDIRIGTKLPVYCTAMGKVLMAFGAKHKTHSILSQLKFRQLTPHTIDRLEQFLDELSMVQELGYAINDEELTIGNRSIAAPVLSKQGIAIAAINIAFPVAQYSRGETEAILAPKLIEMARAISIALHQTEAPIAVS